MTINTKEDLIKLIIDHNIPLEKIVKDRCDVDWDYNAKTFYEMGVDDLDIAEIMWDIEKNYDCDITDELFDELGAFGSVIGYGKEKLINPNDLIISVIRDRKLKELGILDDVEIPQKSGIV